MIENEDKLKYIRIAEEAKSDPALRIVPIDTIMYNPDNTTIYDLRKT